MSDESLTEAFAKELASMDVDHELQKRHDLVPHREKLLKSKIGYHKRELESWLKKNEHELHAAQQLVDYWFRHLQPDKKKLFQHDIDRLHQAVSSEDFSEQLLNALFNPDPSSIRKLLGLSDDFVDSLFDEAQRLVHENHLREAIHLNRLVALLNPQLLAIYHSIGYCFFRLHNLEEAQNFFDLSITLAPDDPKGYYLAAVCSKERKEDSHAKIFLDAGLELSKPYPEWEKKFQELKNTIPN